MSEIIDQFYTPLLIEHGFIHDPDNQQYGALGDCWKLSPEVGEGSYWTYGQKDLYDIKIHNFSFHEDFMLECSLPECLSITRYDSISGEELSPYRRLSAGCIKTFIGGYAPYKALIHKNIPIRSVGIEIAPAYYEDYLKKLYPEAQINPVDAFRKIDQTSDFPEMQSGTHFAKTGGFRLHGTRLFHACWGVAPIPSEHKNCVLERWINPSAARFCKSLMGGQLSDALPLFPVVHSLPPAPYPTPEYGRYWPWPSAALSFPHGLFGSRRRPLSSPPAARRTRYSAP